jgi:ApbE superfamily uncharacterized protein (UPF0280 family)
MIEQAKRGIGERDYRQRMKPSGGMVSYRIVRDESDLQVSSLTNLRQLAEQLLDEARVIVEGYISQHADFAAALQPIDIKDAPKMIQEMAAAAQLCSVGPMASVAGAVAAYVGKGLRVQSKEVVIENGGDLFLCGDQERTIGIYAGDSPLSWQLGLKVNSCGAELGLCTSSASVGPSLSLGKCDAAVVLADTTIVADALATALGNRISDSSEIAGALEWANSLPGVKGTMAIVGDKMGACGQMELVEL